jgi:hypothetical protein
VVWGVQTPVALASKTASTPTGVTHRENGRQPGPVVTAPSAHD